jgi:predicted enzyme related to lactoylglutathione lyase
MATDYVRLLRGRERPKWRAVGSTSADRGPAPVGARGTIPGMIKAIHTLVYSDDPEATRAFLRDVIGWPSVADPRSTPPWPIYKTGPSEMGVHPTSGGSGEDAYASPRHHSISLMCDDIATTKAELEAKGAVFSGGVSDYGFGLAAMLEVPGADPIMLYEPRHPEAYDL